MLKHCLAYLLIGMLLAPGIALAAARLYQGKIVVTGEHQITVVDKDGDNDNFVVSSTTKITRDGKPARFNDLEIGDRVKVNAQLKSGTLEASDIEARSAE